jgi:hypothetical protein
LQAIAARICKVQDEAELRRVWPRELDQQAGLQQSKGDHVKWRETDLYSFRRARRAGQIVFEGKASSEPGTLAKVIRKRAPHTARTAKFVSAFGNLKFVSF